VRFADPWWLSAVTVLPLWWLANRKRIEPAAVYSDVSLLIAPTAKSLKLRTAFLPPFLSTLGVLAAIVALARPQVSESDSELRSRGRGISVVLDVSGSMAKTISVSAGVKTTRLDQAKTIVADLLKRPTLATDEFGLTTFAAVPQSLSPTTSEHRYVEAKLAAAEIDARDNRTEIGAGIALGLDLVREWPEGETAVVLFTDGAQRVEEGIGPLAGARLAEALRIPLFIVHFADDPEEAADLKTLARMAAIGKGRLFHWKNVTAEAIANALPPIPPQRESVVAWRDVFPSWIASSLLLLVVAESLKRTVYRTLPESAD
jgi:Ca-activated chloride channel family protein